MAVEKNLQSVKILYELKQYKAALEMASDLYDLDNESDEAKELLLIAAKSLLFLTSSPTSKKRINDFIDVVLNACDHAASVDDVIDIAIEILDTFAEWHLEVLKSVLKIVEKDANNDAYLKYLKLTGEFGWVELLLTLKIENCKLIKEYLEENNITLDEFIEKFNLTERLPKDLTNQKIGEYEYETAINIYEKAKTILDANTQGNPDFLYKVTRIITNALFTAEQLIEKSIPNDGFTSYVRCERLLKKAEILTYRITAKVYPNGKTVYIWPEESRTKVLDEINMIHLEVKNYELNSEKLESQKDDLIKKIKASQENSESIDIEAEQQRWEQKFSRKGLEYEEKIKQENLNHERIWGQIEQDIVAKENKKDEINKEKLKEIEEKKETLRQKKSKLGMFNLSAKKDIDTELTRLDNVYKQIKEEKLLSHDEIKEKIELAKQDQYQKHLQTIEDIKSKYGVPMSPKEKLMIREKYKNGDEEEQIKYKILLILDCADKLTVKQITTLLKECFKVRDETTLFCEILVEDGLVERQQGVSEFEYWVKK